MEGDVDVSVHAGILFGGVALSGSSVCCLKNKQLSQLQS